MRRMTLTLLVLSLYAAQVSHIVKASYVAQSLYNCIPTYEHRGETYQNCSTSNNNTIHKEVTWLITFPDDHTRFAYPDGVGRCKAATACCDASFRNIECYPFFNTPTTDSNYWEQIVVSRFAGSNQVNCAGGYAQATQVTCFESSRSTFRVEHTCSFASGGSCPTICAASMLTHLRHELRTPVNSILGFSDMLIHDARNAGLADLDADLQKLRRSGQRLLEIIDEAVAGRPPAITPADLPAFVEQIHFRLRTPLNVVINYSEMLADEWAALGESFVSDLSRVGAAGRRLLARINDIADFGSRVEDVGRCGVGAGQPAARAGYRCPGPHTRR